MKLIFKFMVFLIGMLFVSFQFAQAKSPLPEGLDELFEEMAELEESYEKGQWQEAQKRVDEVNDELKELLEKSQRNDLAEEKKMLSKDLYNLRGSIRDKDTEQTEINYIKFQKRFFNFLNNFDYEIHPVLSIIDKYINEEAAEAAAEHDFDDVISEMRQVSYLIKLAQPLLKEKGFTDKEFSDFRSKIVAVSRAGKEKDVIQVNEKLKEVQEEYKLILALFN